MTTVTAFQRRSHRAETIPGPPPAPSVEETAACRAAIYVTEVWGALGQVPPIPVTAWHGAPSGTAVADLDGGGRLYHVPGGPITNLHLSIDCAQGERHHYTITWPRDLDTARAAAAECTHDPDAPEHLDDTDTAKVGFPYHQPTEYTRPTGPEDTAKAALATVRRIRAAGE